jgi:hypothetical protein
MKVGSSLRHSGAGKANGSLGDLAPSHVHALVDLDVRANVDAGGLRVVRHGLHVLLKQVEIDDHRGRGQNVLGDIAEIAPGNARVELRIRIIAACGFGGPDSGGLEKTRGGPRHQELSA